MNWLLGMTDQLFARFVVCCDQVSYPELRNDLARDKLKYALEMGRKVTSLK